MGCHSKLVLGQTGLFGSKGKGFGIISALAVGKAVWVEHLRSQPAVTLGDLLSPAAGFAPDNTPPHS